MARRSAVVRFGVGDPNGVHGAVWRMWTGVGDESVYISGQTFGGQYKVSLHPTKHLAGLTAEEQRILRERGQLPPLRASWSPSGELLPGVERLYVVVEPRSEVVYTGAVPKATAVLFWAPPPEGWATEFQIWKAPASSPTFVAEGTRQFWTAPLGNLSMLALCVRDVEFNAGYLQETIQEYRNAAMQTKAIREEVQAGAEFGILVDAVHNPSGMPFQLHVAVTIPGPDTLGS
jgi:hypothetical protein